MSIQEIIQKGHGHAGSNGSWRVERVDSDPFVGSEFELWHYSTLMLRWRKSKRHGVEILHTSTGWGGVADQSGMNTAFRVLGVPLRFDRDERGGGPRIADISDLTAA